MNQSSKMADLFKIGEIFFLSLKTSKLIFYFLYIIKEISLKKVIKLWQAKKFKMANSFKMSVILFFSMACFPIRFKPSNSNAKDFRGIPNSTSSNATSLQHTNPGWEFQAGHQVQ
jgi:hypothetical protein